MSRVFTDYPLSSDSISGLDNKSEIQCDDIGQLIISIGKLCKEMKKQRKIIKRMCKHDKIEKMSEQSAQENQHSSAEKNNKTTKSGRNSNPDGDDKKEKTFFEKVGDAFLKALPSIFRTVASVAATAILGRCTKWFGTFRRARNV